MEPSSSDPYDPRWHFALRIAEETGRRLVALRASGRWRDEAMLGDIGDQAADAYLQGSLRTAYPDEGLLSEETADAPERLAKRCAWILDPLDGTNEYASGRHDWAVHVGLAVDGRAVMGVVALPAIGRVMAGVTNTSGDVRTVVTGAGGDWPTAFATDDGPVHGRPLRLVASRSHSPDWISRLARDLGGAELVPCGSVGFKVAMLLFGQADAYVHKRGLKEWDTCAPEAVARACGFSVCRFDGGAHRYNQPNPLSDEIVVCRPWLRDRLLAALPAQR